MFNVSDDASDATTRTQGPVTQSMLRTPAMIRLDTDDGFELDLDDDMEGVGLRNLSDDGESGIWKVISI